MHDPHTQDGSCTSSQACLRLQVRLLCVALNYEGTDSELTCRVDAERLIAVARKAGVRDIVRLYDTGDTDRFPCKEEVCALPRSVAKVS